MADKREQAQQDQIAEAQVEYAGGQQVQAMTTGTPASIEATARELTDDSDDERDIFSHISHPKKRRFLIRYGDTGGSIVKAAKLVGISRRTHTQWMHSDPEYAEAFEQAQQHALETVESEIIRRGVVGYKEPIIYQGKITGLVRRHSDLLLMFLAKKLNPAYRDNWTQQIGIMAGGKVQINFGIPRPDKDSDGGFQFDADGNSDGGNGNNGDGSL